MATLESLKSVRALSAPTQVITSFQSSGGIGLRVLLTSTPDMETPMTHGIMWVWSHYQNYPSWRPTWAQQLGSWAKHRAVGQHFSFRPELRVFEA